MKIYIIRHSDPDYSDDTLTINGQKEAQALAKRLCLEKIDAIFSSPLGRAKDTAKYTAEKTGLQISVEPWLKEIPGWIVNIEPFQEMEAWEIPGEVIRKKNPLPTHTSWFNDPPLSEPRFVEYFEFLLDCSDDFFKRLGYSREGYRYRIEKPNRKSIAVFCHGGVGVTWLAHLLEIPLSIAWAGFWLAPSSVTTILFEERSNNWAIPRCIGLGDTSHLYADKLQIQHRGLFSQH